MGFRAGALRASMGALALFMVLATGAAHAQPAWPQGRTIRIIVPFAAGGATDVIARIMGDKLSRLWSASIVIENRGGAGGNIGTDMAARAAPDGDTMLMVSVGMATNIYLYKKLSYDPVADFAPVSLVARVPNMLIAGADRPYRSVPELIAWGRANPGKLSFASSGVGTSIHLSGELFKKLTGVDMAHVPYRGSAPALQDILGGRVDLMFDNITASLPQARAGLVQALGVTTAQRSVSAPELPPIADTVPGFDVSSWFAFFAPAKTPPAIVERMSRDVRAALADPAVREKFAALAAEPVGSTPKELEDFFARERDTWGKLIREAGLSAE